MYNLAFAFNLFFIGAGLAVAAIVLSTRLVPEKARQPRIAWIRSWAIKGLLAPCCAWALFNIGLFSWLPPLMPQVQAAQLKPAPWFPMYARVFAGGVYAIGSFWAAETLIWCLVQAGKGLEGEGRAKFNGLCWTSGIGMGLIGLMMLAGTGWSALGIALFAVAAPVAAYAPGIVSEPKRPPMYARAIARIKRGKYNEAEWEIIKQLETAEDDFDGWMMMATLYAENYRDVAEAEQTVLDMCDQPSITASQISVALHRLADWHLKISSDPDAARRALQIVCDRLPGSHLAHMAELRIRQLPKTREELQEQQTAAVIPLPALGDSLDDDQSLASPPMERSRAVAIANSCVQRLREDPNDAATREKLARVMAEHLTNADQAIEQVKLLLRLPDRPDSERVKWMSLIAAWHLKLRNDKPAAKQVLRQLIQQFPGTPQAIMAERRMTLLEREERFTEQKQKTESAKPKTIRLKDAI